MAGQRRRVSKRRLAGFTLLELTAALAIVSAVAAATFHLQHQGFRAFRRANQLTEAVLLAQEKLVEVQLSPPHPRQGRTRTSAGDDLFWEVAVSAASHPGVRAVRVRIRSEEKAAPILEAMTYVASP